MNELVREVINDFAYGYTADQVAEMENISFNQVNSIYNEYVFEIDDKKTFLKNITPLKNKSIKNKNIKSSTNGIDVSKHNGVIDWSKVKGNVNFAIIRAGYGKQISQKDIKFETNYKGCKDNNILCGAYWYSYALSVEEIKQEANVFLSVIKGKKFEYPVFLDIEEQSQSKLSSITINAMIKAFCNVLESNGYFVGVYSYDSFFSKVDKDTQLKYTQWVANTSTSPKTAISYGIHQHSFKGIIKGITGYVDKNYCYIDYPIIIISGGFNNYKTLKGDINLDGKVNLTDLNELKKALALGTNLNNNADMNSDGKINSADLLLLKKKLNE